LVNSSHSAVFIFDEKNEFQGLISPYKTIYSDSYPYTTKVVSIIFTPPYITKQTPLYEVADRMLSTRIYTLPIFTAKGELNGVIHAKNILQNIVRDPNHLSSISREIQLRNPVTALISSSLGEVFQKLKEKSVSRVILVDKNGKLEGIISRGDLIKAFIKPTSKNRFAPEGTEAGYYSLAGEKKSRTNEPARKYFSAVVSSLPDSAPRDKIILSLIKSPHNSMILVDKNNKPTGFLSTRDLLQAIAALAPEESVPLIMKKPSKSVPAKEFGEAESQLMRFGRNLKKRMEIEKIEVASEEPKNAHGQTKVFNTTVMVTPVSGKSFVVITKQREYLDGIQEAIVLIEKQRRRSGFSKKDTAKSRKAKFKPELISLQELQKEEEGSGINFEELEKTSPQIVGEQSASGQMPNPNFVTRKTTLERAKKMGVYKNGSKHYANK
jgi:CBS domain-containing protein